MTPRFRTDEARWWWALGAAFESDTPPHHGICLAQFESGYPAYGDPAARVQVDDDHGPYFPSRLASWTRRREAANHRAMTCYLMARMIDDDCAPGGPPRQPNFSRLL